MATTTESTFGEHLLNNEGKQVSTATLKDKKVIGVFFTRKGYPRANDTHPIILSFYEKVQKERPGVLEMILADRTHDKDNSAEILKDLPFPSFEPESKLAQELFSKHRPKVKLFPVVAFLKPDGTPICTLDCGDFQRAVWDKVPDWELKYIDSLVKGEKPDTPKNLVHFGENLHSHKGPVPVSSLKDFKLLLVLQGVGEDPDCQAFNPILTEFYKTIKAKRPNDLEIIYFPYDESEEEFKEAYKGMTWPSFNFKDEVHQRFDNSWDIGFLPTLSIFKPDGSLQSNEGYVIQKYFHSGIPDWENHVVDCWLKGEDPKEPPKKLTLTGTFDKAGAKVSSEDVLKNKLIGIHLTRKGPKNEEFTKHLIQLYNKLKETRPGDLEIISISRDKTPEEAAEVLATVPWAKYEFKDKRAEGHFALIEELNTRPPALLIFKPDGSLVAQRGKDGVTYVERNVAGWENTVIDAWLKGGEVERLPINISFDGEFIDHKGKVEAAAVKANKVIGVYFSAHWCGPCRHFTPELAEFYKKVKAARPNDFEVVYAALWQEKKTEFDEYYESMPWVALPHADPRIEKWADELEVNGIPSFQIFHPDGKHVTDDGRVISQMKEKGVEDWENKVIDAWISGKNPEVPK